MANPPSHRLILASGSPRRSDLLRNLGLEFEVMPPDDDERSRHGDESPAGYARALAEHKARSVAESVAGDRQAAVLGMDTVVVLDDVVLGKPRDDDDAVAMLERLSGRTHEVITAWFLVRLTDEESRAGHVDTAVRFVKSDRPLLRAYVSTGEPADKAGAYAIQGAGSFLVHEIQGSYSNVVGLPLAEVLTDIEQLTGMRPWGA